MKTAKVIVNVGYINGNGEPEFYNAFLCKASSGEEFIAIVKPAVTINGTAYVKTFCWLRREDIGVSSTTNIPQSIINRLAYNIDVVLSEETQIYNRIKEGVFTNEAAILAITPTFQATIAAVTAPWTVKGALTQQAEVDALLDVAAIAEPVGNGTGGGILIPTPNAEAFPTLDKKPLEAAQAFFKKPIEYAKENPVSTVFMVVGIAQLANYAGLIKFNPLKKVSKLLK